MDAFGNYQNWVGGFFNPFSAPASRNPWEQLYDAQSGNSQRANISPFPQGFGTLGAMLGRFSENHRTSYERIYSGCESAIREIRAIAKEEIVIE